MHYVDKTEAAWEHKDREKIQIKNVWDCNKSYLDQYWICYYCTSIKNKEFSKV